MSKSASAKPPQNSFPMPHVLPAGSSNMTLDALYRRYAPWLSFMLRRRFGRTVETCSDDVIQETYLRIAPYVSEGNVRHPSALLLRIAVNLVVQRIRQTARRRGPLQVEQIIERVEYGGFEQDQTVLLKQVILALPDHLRDVFVLSRFAGMTNQQLAEHFGLALKTVEGRITQARAHVARQLCD